MNGHTCHENLGCPEGCHAGMEQLARQPNPLDVRRIATGVGLFLLSFVVFLFLLGKLLPGMHSAGTQGILALLALAATAGAALATRKLSHVLASHA